MLLEDFSQPCLLLPSRWSLSIGCRNPWNLHGLVSKTCLHVSKSWESEFPKLNHHKFEAIKPQISPPLSKSIFSPSIRVLDILVKLIRFSFELKLNLDAKHRFGCLSTHFEGQFHESCPGLDQFRSSYDLGKNKWRTQPIDPFSLLFKLGLG